MGLPALSLDRHIEEREGVRGGKPCLSGTRIAVSDVVILNLRLGQSPEEIAAKYGLALPAVHAAMAYYYDHRSGLDARIAEELAFAESMEAEAAGSSPLRKKLVALGLA